MIGWWIGVAVAAEQQGNFIPAHTSIGQRLVSFVGIFAFLGLAWAMSEKRDAIRWRPVIWGVALQLVFGAIILSPTISHFFYTVVDGGVRQLLAFSEAGATFLFG